MSAGKTIAVVDDNYDMRQIVKTILEHKGHQVVCADSGAELFTEIEDRVPDLVLLDIMMPEMDGIEVLRRLKQSAETSSIPVIMLSVRGYHEDIIEAYRLGCEFYLTKPFEPATLLNSIHAVFAG